MPKCLNPQSTHKKVVRMKTHKTNQKCESSHTKNGKMETTKINWWVSLWLNPFLHQAQGYRAELKTHRATPLILPRGRAAGDGHFCTRKRASQRLRFPSQPLPTTLTLGESGYPRAQPSLGDGGGRGSVSLKGERALFTELVAWNLLLTLSKWLVGTQNQGVMDH